MTLKALIFGARSERFSGLGVEQLALDLLDGRAEETRKTAAGNDDVPPSEQADKTPRKKGSSQNLFQILRYERESDFLMPIPLP